MILIIDCKSEKVSDIKNILDNNMIDNKVVPLDSLESFDISSFSGIIISGGPFKLEESKSKFEFIKTFNRPVLGICFGHQIIGLVYGSDHFGTDRIKDSQKINILEKNNLFLGLDNVEEFIQDHFEHITLPEDFILLANSNLCDVEAMKHKNKFLYGVQFHPEVSGKVGEKVLLNFCKLCRN